MEGGKLNDLGRQSACSQEVIGAKGHLDLLFVSLDWGVELDLISIERP
jgi:poly-gamma-glutamate capsule biosynthesis protein CapA/YwtB (metallophosphatase superfamily)